jgi:4-hydroxyphenylacetate 3-monooxygenase
VKDVYMHVVDERDDGLVVSGAKVVATTSSLTHFNFIANNGALPIKTKPFAFVCMVPTGAPGVKLLCRPSYEMMSAVMGTPFDYPLSSRMDENDSILIFDKVFVPYEDVFAYGDIEKVNNFFPRSGFLPRFMFQGCTRLAVKLDFLIGAFIKALEATGTIAFRGIQVSVGELLAWRNTFWALTDAMCHNPVPSAEGSVIPNNQAGSAYRILSNIAIPKIKEIIENQVAGAMIVQPSHAVDWKNEELRPLLDQFYRGSNGYEAVDKIKLVKLLWDAVGSEFGGRHELYERTYSGSHELTRLECWWMAQGDGTVDRMKGFAEQCMAEYDLDGWTVDDLINPDDINLITGK